jgi:hypothetical protein
MKSIDPKVPKVPFNGKAIYQPSGKAAEYAGYACNFYVGCSCGCTYCYNGCSRKTSATVAGADGSGAAVSCGSMNRILKNGVIF